MIKNDVMGWLLQKCMKKNCNAEYGFGMSEDLDVWPMLLHMLDAMV